MITLKRTEEIEIYQVELALKVKTKQSAFIAILVLALEQEEIDAISLKANLLTALPERACENLLKRLSEQGYLVEKKHGSFSSFYLSELGEQCAADKSFWIGEKGAYNVYVSKSNLIQQDIIFIEKGKIEIVEQRKQKDGSVNIKEVKTPKFRKSEYSLFIKDTFYDEQLKQTITKIEKKETHIESIDVKCFPLKTEVCNLEIHAKDSETTLRVTNNGQTLFTADLDIDEAILQEELLASCPEFEYHEDKRAILTTFNKDILSFNRKTKIKQPILQRNTFSPIELENIYHIPSDKRNAELWYSELLYKNLNHYFLDENSFHEYAIELALPIQTHFKVSVPNRNKFAKQLSEREDAFYQIAKLETIDFLNY